MEFCIVLLDFFGFNAIGPETLLHFLPTTFWVLVSFNLEYTWKLEICSIGILVYKDSKFLVFKTKQCTLKGVERGDFLLKKIKIAHFIKTGMVLQHPDFEFEHDDFS